MLINRVVVHRVVFFIALMFLLVGIPFCRPFMSIGGILLVANWFLEGDFVRKWYQTKNNKLLFIVLLFFFVYLMGLVYTENYPQAWKSIWLKIPLFFIPVIFATTKPLSTIEFHNLLKVYLVGVLISSVYGFIHYHQNDLIDKREIAVYISYIRFEMNLCFYFVVFTTEGKVSLATMLVANLFSLDFLSHYLCWGTNGFDNVGIVVLCVAS